MKKELPSYQEILKNWWDWILDYDPEFDFTNPMCWACNEYWFGRYSFDIENATIEQIAKKWQKAPLERCHIIPESKGGSNDSSNIVLLCKTCHEFAPDIIDREIFLRWMLNRRLNFNSEAESICLAISEMGFELEDVDNTVQKITDNSLIKKAVSKHFKENAAFHWSKFGGKKIKATTGIKLLMDFNSER